MPLESRPGNHFFALKHSIGYLGMQNTPDWGSFMVWDGESEYMRMSTKVVAINMGQVLSQLRVPRALLRVSKASLGVQRAIFGVPRASQEGDPKTKGS